VLAGKVYPHEIGIQETRTNHRKLDSQATLSHRARGRAPDGLRSQAWSLRASRRDYDPSRLSARPASLGGLRPAMAADRAVRGSSAFKNGIASVHPIRGDEMRALRKLRRDYPREAYVFVSERGGPISPIGFHRLVQRLGHKKHPAYGPVHRHGARQVQGFLERLTWPRGGWRTSSVGSAFEVRHPMLTVQEFPSALSVPTTLAARPLSDRS